MAAERKRVMGELAAWHAAMIVVFMPFTGKVLSPSAINPYADRKVSAKIAAVRAFIAVQGIAALGGFGAGDQ